MGEKRKVRAGDHLWVQRLGYEHHGLATGPHTVIHYSGKDERTETGVIEEVPISMFAKDRAVRFIDHPDRLHNRKESVRRARERIGEDKYNLLYNNCEHLVLWCIEAKQTSEQVKRAVRRVSFADTSMSMYRWYSMWATEKSAAGPTIRTAVHLLKAGRATSTALNATNAACATTALMPTIGAAVRLSDARTAASLAPIAKGLTARVLTNGLVGTTATTAGIISAPISLPIIAVAVGVGLTVTAASALWDSVFD